MRILGLGRYALSASAVAVFLVGCVASSVSGARPPTNDLAGASLHNKTFYYTGGQQSFKVPRGVTAIDIVARGAAGGGDYFGRGGRVHAIIPVQPGETLYVFVGGKGSSASGGFNGGGNPGAGGVSNGGGGASDVREGGSSVSDRVLVGAGGGGEGRQVWIQWGGHLLLQQSSLLWRRWRHGRHSKSGRVRRRGRLWQ
jgi:hypothetical protein